MRNKIRGFTLIELVIVIITLAILASLAVPKFLNLRRDTEESRVKAIAAAYQQSVSFVNMRWNVLGLKTGLNNLDGFADDTLDLSGTGYPLGTNKNSPMRAPKNIGKGNIACVMLWDILLTDPPAASLNNDGSDFQAYRVRNGTAYNECHYILRTLGDTASDITTAEMAIQYNAETGIVTTIIQ